MTKEANTKLTQLFGASTESKCNDLVTLELDVKLLIFVIFICKEYINLRSLVESEDKQAAVHVLGGLCVSMTNK